jgi:hypothetical protein
VRGEISNFTATAGRIPPAMPISGLKDAGRAGSTRFVWIKTTLQRLEDQAGR